MKTLASIVLALSLATFANKDLQKVQINNSPLDTISAHLPGIGPSIAERIVQGRPYRTCADLDAVKGIGKAKLAKICPFLIF